MEDVWGLQSLSKLGEDNIATRWAVIDLETSGIDPLNDSIIDVGFLQFEGCKLVSKYSSLVRFPMTSDRHDNLSQFIQKLTGITKKMLKRAPVWGEVLPEIQQLHGHHLLAHNSDFEKGFLNTYFKPLDDARDGKVTSFEDSLFYFGLLFPEKSSLSLETIIIDLALADKEIHRGLEDSIDLLRALLLATYIFHQDILKTAHLKSLLMQQGLEDYFYARFFALSDNELEEIAQQIDFDLKQAFKNYQDHQLQANHNTYLKLAPDSLDFNGDNIRKIFEDEDKLKQNFPHYRHRQTQVQLALRVGQAFKNNIHALVQAPTGTGKTLGYLLPSALYALNNDEKVLVATGTKALQHQAMTKDVPQLKAILGLGNDFKVSHLLGSNNHLCELLFRQKEDGGELLTKSKSFEERFSEIYFEMVFKFNSQVDYSEKILRGDLAYVLKRKLQALEEREREIAVDFRACTGSKCPFKGDCSYITGLREAKDANIIIGNHALMFTWPRGIPRPSHIVVDEAHKIENEATSAFSLEASSFGLDLFKRTLVHLQGVGALFYLLSVYEDNPGSSTDTITKIRNECQASAQRLDNHLIPLATCIEALFKKRGNYTGLYWNEIPFIKREDSTDSLAHSILNHFEGVHFILRDLYQLLSPYLAMFDVNALEGDNEVTAWARFEAFMGQLEDLHTAVASSLNSENDQAFTRSLFFHESEGFKTLVAPIDIGKSLFEGLLSTSASVVFTSATLANASGECGVKGIDWATGHIYLDPAKRFKSGLFLPAVYDYENKTKVFICDDVPGLHQNNFVEKAMQEVIPLITQLGGRALLLFSAKKRFETAREMLIAAFEGETPLFIQGMGNNVVEEFKKSGQGILLGMESFGEGIDIPGEALQFVFIDKIPDLRMDLVIQKRREYYQRHFGNEFVDYFLAHRARSLHQKLGRLLRTEADFGAIIVVDSRIKNWKGNTLKTFMQLMAPYHMQRCSLKDACQQSLEFINHSGRQLTSDQDSEINHLPNCERT